MKEEVKEEETKQSRDEKKKEKEQRSIVRPQLYEKSYKWENNDKDYPRLGSPFYFFVK